MWGRAKGAAPWVPVPGGVRDAQARPAGWGREEGVAGGLAGPARGEVSGLVRPSKASQGGGPQGSILGGRQDLS